MRLEILHIKRHSCKRKGVAVGIVVGHSLQRVGIGAEIQGPGVPTLHIAEGGLQMEGHYCFIAVNSVLVPCSLSSTISFNVLPSGATTIFAIRSEERREGK